MLKGRRQDGKNITPNIYWALASLLSAPALTGLLMYPAQLKITASTPHQLDPSSKLPILSL